MKTNLKSSLRGAINVIFAGVTGLIVTGVVLLGWEWHSAHPGKHAKPPHASEGSSKHDETPPATDEGSGATATNNSPAPVSGASHTHHSKKHKH